MVLIEPWSGAPAGTYNPFANDKRCVAVHYAAGDNWAEVTDAMKALVDDDHTLSDYDAYYDDTVERWIGVTCRDV